MGKLYFDDELICHTIERPWLDNKTNISCIPAGLYKISSTVSPKFGDTYKVRDVPHRTHILFHKANKASELQGCIAPVAKFGILKDAEGRCEWAGLSSKHAYDKLMALLDGEDYMLRIIRH